MTYNVLMGTLNSTHSVVGCCAVHNGTVRCCATYVCVILVTQTRAELAYVMLTVGLSLSLSLSLCVFVYVLAG